MEHSWGRNIYAIGLGDTGASLAARDVFSGILYLTNERLPFPFVRYWLIPSVFTLNYSTIDLNVGADWYLPFPYNRFVIPDVHL